MLPSLRAERPAVTVNDVIRDACGYFGLTENELTGPSRKNDIVAARHLSMYLAKSLTQAPLKMIGAAFGGRDHSTVIHACKRIEKQSSYDTSVSRQLKELREQIENSHRGAA